MLGHYLRVGSRSHRRLFSLGARRRINTVLIYGDSLVWCYDPIKSSASTIKRIPFEKRWTTHLSHILGNSYNVISEGLNGRTTVFHDPLPPGDGDYNCCGRDLLVTILHSHKPVSSIVLCLGANDLKMKFSATHQDIVAGVKLLIRDIQRSNGIGVGHGQIAPKILVLGPPVIHLTPTSTAWGFPKDVETKTKKISALLSPVCRTMGVGFLNLANVAAVSKADGIHFDESAQELLATSVSEKLLELYRQPEL